MSESSVITSISQVAGESDRRKIEDALKKLKASDLPIELERLEGSGLTADRWTSPDLKAQIRSLAQQPVKHILVNGLDLDAALPLQRTLIDLFAFDIAAGAAALGKLAGTSRVTLAVPEDLSSPSVARLRAAASATGVRLYPMQMDYPAANPSLLIRRVLGRKLAPGKLPTQAGVLLLDAPAALAAGRWFVHREPMQRVPTGVYDRENSRQHFLWVPVGTRLADVLLHVEIDADKYEFRAAQMLRDVTVSPDDVIGANELTIFVSHPSPAPEISACLRCGWCVEACPVNIHPAGLLDAAQQNDPHLAERYGLKSCIECGICSYVCPARLPLLQSIREMRVNPNQRVGD